LLFYNIDKLELFRKLVTYEWISVYRLFLIIDFVVIGKHAYGRDNND